MFPSLSFNKFELLSWIVLWIWSFQNQGETVHSCEVCVGLFFRNDEHPQLLLASEKAAVAQQQWKPAREKLQMI